jgi:integrase
MGKFLNFIADELRLRNFSPKTIKVYCHAIEELYKYYSKSPRDITNDEIKKYLLNMFEKGYSTQTVSLTLNAINFLYREIYKNPLKINIKHPKRPQKLPTLLTREEIQKLLSTYQNKKHRLLIALSYSAGLRVSEAVNLKVADIDLSETLLMVKAGKGQKDRRTVEEIRNIFKVTASDIFDSNPIYTGKLGAGAINAYNAVMFTKGEIFPDYLNNSLNGNINIQNSTSTISAKWKFYNATKYYYQITKDSSLTVLTSSKTTTQTSITEEMELENETTYYIYVQGENAEGEKSKVYRTNGVYVKSNIGSYGEETEMLYNSGVKINIPANTFSEDYKIEVETKGPSETIISQANNKIENSTYRSYAQISGKYYEFKARKKSDGTEIKNFDKGITIKIPYTDADGDGIIDGTSVKVKSLKIYYLNESNVEWEKMKNVWYDTTNKTVNFMTDHFSIYGLLESEEEGTELEKIIIYPNPCKIKEIKNVIIGNLPIEIEDLKIEIYDISGKLLKKLDKNNVEREVSGNKIYWNGMSNKNERLASGIYIARISSQGSHKTFKIAILN